MAFANKSNFMDLGGISLVVGDILIASSANQVDGATDLTAVDVKALAGVVAGTVSASSALIVDSNSALTGMGSLTFAAGAFVNESASNAVTPFNGGGQASAVALTSELNRISTSVATTSPFDSIKLPASVAGRTIIVINDSANPIQVFGASSDTIDLITTTVGVTQMQKSMVIYSCTAAGDWKSEGLGTGYTLGGLQTMASLGGLTAVGTNRGTALALVSSFNRITTAAALTGVVLPASAVGLAILVSNQGANPIFVYGAGSDTVDGVAGATGKLQPAGSVYTYNSVTAGAWETGLGQGTAASPRLCHTGARPPASNADFTSATPVSTETYVCEVFVPCTMTVTGISTVNGSAVSGNVTVYLSDHAGNKVANSASTAQSGTSAYQRIPFTAAVTIPGPATYYVVQQHDNGTARYGAHVFGDFTAFKATGTTYGTYPTVSIVNTFTTNLGPVAHLYA